MHISLEEYVGYEWESPIRPRRLYREWLLDGKLGGGAFAGVLKDWGDVLRSLCRHEDLSLL